MTDDWHDDKALCESYPASEKAMSGHTPGPWRLDKFSARGDYDVCAPSYEGGNPVGWFFYIGHGLDYDSDEQALFDEFEANARLVEKAPETAAELERAQETIADLLEALDFYARCEHWMSIGEDGPCTSFVAMKGDDVNGYAVAEAAISRATTGTARSGLTITGQRWGDGELLAVEINGDETGQAPWFVRERTPGTGAQE